MTPEEQAYKRYLERLDEATEVTDYDGWLYCEEAWGSMDGYFMQMEDLTDALEECEGESESQPFVWPQFAFCCKGKVEPLDLERVLDLVTDEGFEDGYEEIRERLQGVAELRAAVDAFNELNQEALTRWEIDYTRKVRIPAKEEA